MFTLPITILPSDIDGLDHVNNVTYLRWIQEIAIAHWEAATSAADREKLYWVVVRHEIDYKQSARLGDAITARTWVCPASRIKFERHTEITRDRDHAVLARARSLWCPMDAATHRPTPPSAAVRAAFSAPEG